MTTDTRLRVLERASNINPGDADARARYVMRLGIVHGLEALAREGNYSILGELDALGEPTAFDVALTAFLVKAARCLYLPAGDGPPVRSRLVVFSVSRGRRFANVKRQHGGVYCYVDLKGGKVRGSDTLRGDILKVSGKAALAHARGSIFDAHGGAEAVNWYGAKGIDEMPAGRRPRSRP